MTVEIIAEAGVNHNGDISLAKLLIDAAIKSGANIVKFQTFKAERLATSNAPKAKYQVANTPVQKNQLEMLRRLELTHEDYEILVDYCDSNGDLSGPISEHLQ